MHYLKASLWIILALGIWITSHFVAVILFLVGGIYGLGVIIKMEREDD